MRSAVGDVGRLCLEGSTHCSADIPSEEICRRVNGSRRVAVYVDFIFCEPSEIRITFWLFVLRYQQLGHASGSGIGTVVVITTGRVTRRGSRVRVASGTGTGWSWPTCTDPPNPWAPVHRAINGDGLRLNHGYPPTRPQSAGTRTRAHGSGQRRSNDNARHQVTGHARAIVTRHTLDTRGMRLRRGLSVTSGTLPSQPDSAELSNATTDSGPAQRSTGTLPVCNKAVGWKLAALSLAHRLPVAATGARAAMQQSSCACPASANSAPLEWQDLKSSEVFVFCEHRTSVDSVDYAEAIRSGLQRPTKLTVLRPPVLHPRNRSYAASTASVSTHSKSLLEDVLDRQRCSRVNLLAAKSTSFLFAKPPTATEQFSARCRSSAPPRFMTRLVTFANQVDPYSFSQLRYEEPTARTPQAQTREKDVESAVALPQFGLARPESRYHSEILTDRPPSLASRRVY
ncbi:hypothetical protein C8R47DRAFT_1250644 [Mycena vitilis]|nr:hypothetical protein C8R47DRAFT_1250644 [Mycena vitilis]